MLKNLPKLLRRQEAGSSPSEVNGVNIKRQRCRDVLHSGPRSANLLAQPVHILLHPLHTENSRGKVAERALRLAERNRDVKANSSRHSKNNASPNCFTES